jgi:hypothetical protein
MLPSVPDRNEESAAWDGGGALGISNDGLGLGCEPPLSEVKGTKDSDEEEVSTGAVGKGKGGDIIGRMEVEL